MGKNIVIGFLLIALLVTGLISSSSYGKLRKEYNQYLTIDETIPSDETISELEPVIEYIPYIDYQHEESQEMFERRMIEELAKALMYSHGYIVYEKNEEGLEVFKIDINWDNRD